MAGAYQVAPPPAPLLGRVGDLPPSCSAGDYPWDGAEICASFEGGMAAISTTLRALLRSGDIVLHSVPVYGGTDYPPNHLHLSPWRSRLQWCGL